MPDARPTVITKSDPRALVIVWDDERETRYTAAALRRLCPCARCVDELTGRALLDAAGVPEDLTHSDVRLVGNYGLSLRFADGHDTGIYPFRMLRENDPDA
jgi:DUF971 family protein